MSRTAQASAGAAAALLSIGLVTGCGSPPSGRADEANSPSVTGA